MPALPRRWVALSAVAFVFSYLGFLAGTRHRSAFHVEHENELGDLCAGFRPLPPADAPDRADPALHGASESSDAVRDAFTGIYANRSWDSDLAGGGSGPGSAPGNTAATRRLLELFFYKRHVTSILDAPCGSSAWWPPLWTAVRRAIPCFRYVGVDVVASVVANSSARHAGDPLTTFRTADVAADPLPRGFDAILSRDALQHLPIATAISALENYARADPRYLLVGSYAPGEYTANWAVQIGGFFRIDLLAPPFSLPEPLEVLEEGYEDKMLLVYARRQLRGLDFAAMRKRAKGMTDRKELDPPSWTVPYVDDGWVPTAEVGETVVAEGDPPQGEDAPVDGEDAPVDGEDAPVDAAGDIEPRSGASGPRNQTKSSD
ncbi:hypothetical protein DFJ74DRAFT_193690 [Hyaloraphidium curvatum]|nr:hypothetical protein DFJ74DRAFT_193690 [Hyaloraphidium curvatum]